jgi:predicted kinase
MMDKFNNTIEQKKSEPIPIVYLDGAIKTIQQQPERVRVVVMRGPQGSGKDFTAFALAEQVGWGFDRIISTDEYYFLNAQELNYVESVLKKIATHEEVLDQREHYDRLSEQDKNELYQYRLECLPKIRGRAGDLSQYHWTPEKRDWAQMYMRVLGRMYLEQGKSFIANVMHTKAFTLKPIFKIADDFGVEIMTLYPDPVQQRVRNGEKVSVKIHDGKQWFPENFSTDNSHGVPPERVDEIANEFEWNLTREKIMQASGY